MIQPMVDIRVGRGKRIHDAILESGKSQREIADLIGVTPQSITKWIKTGKIYVDNLQTLADITEVDMRYLASGVTAKPEISEPAARYDTSGLRDIVAQLDTRQAQKLLMCAHAILDSLGDVEISITVGGKNI